MNSDQLLQAALTMQRLRVGVKEAAVLAAIAQIGDTSQASTIADVTESENPASVRTRLSTLQGKRLIQKVENPTGWPFYKLTSKALSHIHPNPANQ